MIKREEILPLIALQKAQLAFDSVTEQLEKIPADLEKLQQELSSVIERNKQVHLQAETARKKYRNLELTVLDLQQALEKYNKQIYDVKSNKEYSAMVAEIASIKNRISDTETEILLVMDELDVLTKRAAAADEILNKEQSEVEQRMSVLEKQRQDLLEQQEKLATELEEACAAVPARIKNEYDRIREFTGSTVVAPAQVRGDSSYACGGCYMKIRPQTVAELRKGNISQCEACARILYWCDDENG